MSDILSSVDQRTKLVGRNRLELLTFYLNGRQMYAINVFKVQEVMGLPGLHMLPHSHPFVAGVTHIRGTTVPVIDLSAAIGNRPLQRDDKSCIIVTEYNRCVQAFLVSGVDQIVNMNWEDILPPPSGAGRNHFLTAITHINDNIVEIIDVEKVLAGLVPFETDVSAELLDEQLMSFADGLEVLLVEDSPVAVEQASATLRQLRLTMVVESNGLLGLQRLQHWAASEPERLENLLMVVTDAEMPEMDGYRLTAEIRGDPRLQHLPVVMHTSLSGNFNKAMVKQVGCDDFLSKFEPDQLAEVAQARIKARMAAQGLS